MSSKAVRVLLNEIERDLVDHGRFRHTTYGMILSVLKHLVDRIDELEKK